MEHFFSLTPDAGAGEMPRQQALETVKNNIEWIRRNENEISGWLENQLVLFEAGARWSELTLEHRQ